ncbi:copper resistance protein CopC [Micromonospora sp. NBC_01699]|uniref:copper resistance CopC family protein n=1 Tax=Micromonospora sp. NBC_01699 TaxID=2975984 RepID=UPI002E293DE2|nr:copper resistance CopC family protein [Micromonospora sp. NBC_01699]
MRPLRRVVAVLAACVIAAVIAPSPAWAHNSLRTSTPAKGATLDVPPTQVVLEFAERLDPQFTTIAVTTARGMAVTVGKPVVDGVRGTQALTQPLAAGTYTVAFRVVSVDGHPVQGSQVFTLTAAGVTPTTPTPASIAGSPTPTPPAAAVTAADSATGRSGSALGWGLGAAALVAAVGGAVSVLLRRRTSRS